MWKIANFGVVGQLWQFFATWRTYFLLTVRVPIIFEGNLIGNVLEIASSKEELGNTEF